MRNTKAIPFALPGRRPPLERTDSERKRMDIDGGHHRRSIECRRLFEGRVWGPCGLGGHGNLPPDLGEYHTHRLFQLAVFAHAAGDLREGRRDLGLPDERVVRDMYAFLERHRGPRPFNLGWYITYHVRHLPALRCQDAIAVAGRIDLVADALKSVEDESMRQWPAEERPLRKCLCSFSAVRNTVFDE